MIRPLRRRHRLLVSSLAVLLALGVGAGLLARQPAPVMEALPAALARPAMPQRLTQLWAGQTDGDPLAVSASLRGKPGELWLELTAQRALGRPDVLVLWSPTDPGDDGALPADAHWLGTLADGPGRAFRLPVSATGGWVLLYSLAHQERLATLQLPAVMAGERGAMSLGYRAVGWNRQKRRYDTLLLLGVLLYLGLFVSLGAVLRPNDTAETLLIRGLGTGAFLLLHVILVIGPLCRLDSRFLPLLYNRRHMGVTMFVLALAHGALSLLQFHAFGDTNPLVSLFTANTRFDSVSQFPFQPLGFAALLILFLLAATSHDFWLANLGAPTWKALHMLVYVAYGLLVMHVVLGVLQAEAPGAASTALAGLLVAGLVCVLGLHLLAAARETGLDRPAHAVAGFVDVCAVDEIPEKRALMVTVAGDRVAVFRYDGKLSAVSNACQHQNGPLGEGRILDGCITCPWHGYQYLPDCGRSPDPFEETIPTFDVKLEADRVLVGTRPHPPGTRVPPAVVDPGGADSAGTSAREAPA